MLPERFWKKVDRRTPDECWIWIGAHDRDGYGQVWIDGKTQRAYRVAWEDAHGPVPAGLVLDHIVCDNKGCVNHRHLAAVSRWANTARGNAATAINARKERCLRGHLLAEGRVTPTRRVCRVCDVIRHREWKAKRSENGVFA